MQVRASARQVRISAQKARLVLEAIRGKPAVEALAVLSFMPSPTARVVAKVVKSAMANAENNFQLPPGELRVVRAFADEGRTLKRFRAKARGRAGPILKRSSHITVVVEEG